MIIEFENENFAFLTDENQDNEKTFLVAVKDRTIKNEDKFVLVALSEKEAEKFYESLEKYFKK